ncbi:MAG: hypothetical protein IJF92_04100 [Bacilli bacterium]|nr:hypothetical protein [Bacilli bacterium]
MKDFLSDIQNMNYPFDKNTFNLVLDLYNNPKKVFKDNKTINNYITDNGLGGFIFKLLNTEMDTRGKSVLRERNDYLDRLTQDIEKYPYVVTLNNKWIRVDGVNNDKEFNINNIKHRFYISPLREDLYRFSIKLYDKFKENNINFSFKVLDEKYRYNKQHRKDAITIFVDDNNFDDVYKSLEDFSLENKGLIRRCHKPSVITMNFSNWLGYSKEEQNQKDPSSYIGNFAYCFKIALENFCSDYLRKGEYVIIPKKDKEHNYEDVKYNADSFFENSNYYDLRLYELTKEIINNDNKNELYSYLVTALKINNYDIDNFPVSKNKIKIKRPNE